MCAHTRHGVLRCWYERAHLCLGEREAVSLCTHGTDVLPARCTAADEATTRCLGFSSLLEVPGACVSWLCAQTTPIQLQARAGQASGRKLDREWNQQKETVSLTSSAEFTLRPSFST